MPSPEELYPKPSDPQFDYRAPPVEFTYGRRMRYLYELKTYGLLHLAAEKVGVSMSTVRKWRKNEPEFDEACEEARQRYIDGVLVTAAHQRAVHGVERPIIGGRFKDEIVATETVYSDSLLALLLRTARPEFRPSNEAVGTGNNSVKYNLANGGVLIIPQAPATPEEWEEQIGASLRGPEGAK